jgi:hypothetical protein
MLGMSFSRDSCRMAFTVFTHNSNVPKGRCMWRGGGDGGKCATYARHTQPRVHNTHDTKPCAGLNTHTSTGHEQTSRAPGKKDAGDNRWRTHAHASCIHRANNTPVQPTNTHSATAHRPSMRPRAKHQTVIKRRPTPVLSTRRHHCHMQHVCTVTTARNALPPAP